MVPVIDSSDVKGHFLLQAASVQRLLRMELLNRSLEMLVLIFIRNLGYTNSL